MATDAENAQAASDALNAALTGPKRVKGDAGEVEQQPVADLIEADRYLSGKKAAGKARLGVRFTKLIPPGAVD